MELVDNGVPSPTLPSTPSSPIAGSSGLAGPSSPRPPSTVSSTDSLGKCFYCHYCNRGFTSTDNWYMRKRHCTEMSRIPQLSYLEQEGIIRHPPQTALHSHHQIIRFTPRNNSLQPIDFFLLALALITDTINFLFDSCSYIRIQPILLCNLIQIDAATGTVRRREVTPFSIQADISSDFFLTNTINRLLEMISKFMKNGSNWRLEGVTEFCLRITRYRSCPQVKGRGSSHKLPKELADKHAVVNVLNDDDECFRYALLSVLHYKDVRKEYRRKPWAYTKWLNEHNWEGITFPMTTAQLPIFERNNPGLHIHLLAWTKESNTLRTIRHSPIP